MDANQTQARPMMSCRSRGTLPTTARCSAARGRLGVVAGRGRSGRESRGAAHRGVADAVPKRHALTWLRALVVFAAAVAVLSVALPAQARALLCTNSLALKESSVATVAEFMSADAGALTVFREGLDPPEEGFDEIQIVVEMDRPDILASCAEFAGLDIGRLRVFAEELMSRIGQPRRPAPGLPAGDVISVGERLIDGDQEIFLQVSKDGTAVDLLIAIFMALDGDWGQCSVDPGCYGLIDRW